MKNIKYLINSLDIFEKEKIYFPNTKKTLRSLGNDNFILINTHKNNTQVYFNKKENFYRKTIKNKKGIDNLVSELKGLSWYCNLIKKEKKKLIKDYNFKTKKPFLDISNLNGYK